VITLPDAPARARIAGDLDATLVVEAAAGTGKTTALSGRILALVTTGRARLAEIVAVTFTEKAAGELKLRLRADIERARGASEGEVRARLDRALAELEAAHIGTIHGFCGDLLRERPVEAGVDPLFEIAAEEEQGRLFDDAFDAWFSAVLASPGEGVARVLRRESSPRDALHRAGSSLLEHRDFDAPWRRDPIDREAELAEAMREVSWLADLAPDEIDPPDWLDKNLVDIRRARDEIARGPRDLDRLEVALRELSRQWSWKFGGRSGKRAYAGVPRAEVVARRDAAKELIDDVVARCESDLAAVLRAELVPLLALYADRKQRAGKLDFLDLLLETRALLAVPSVARELGARFSHLLVDEFQDTDPLQAEILLRLAGATSEIDGAGPLRPTPGKLFVVGDPKQSIYRFRRADVALYERIKRRLLEGGAELVYLSASFRAHPVIQRVINAAFAPEMLGGDDGVQASYVPLDAVREDAGTAPPVIALPVPRPYGKKKVGKGAIEASYPDAVAAFVDFLVRESGWTVVDRERGGAVLPIAARHVCLLFKRMTGYSGDLTRPYVRALEARTIPHVLVGGRSFHAREEVQALATALAAIEWPDDDLSIYATLRGPFFAFTDDVLLAWRARVGTFHTRRPPPDDLPGPLADVADALSILGLLHAKRNRRPVADTIGALLDATRAHAGVAIWPTGEQALSNLLRMMDLARRFESSGPTSFRGFLDRLAREAERGGGEAPVIEEGTDGVRVMTVHRAKGLEFPIVILCDPTANPAPERPTRWTDPSRRLAVMPLAGCVPPELRERAPEVLARDRAESVRLAYVAVTRARDMLVVPVVGDDPFAGTWLEPLNRAVYPAGDRRRDPTPVPNAPDLGWDSVLQRPDEMVGDDRSVAPGVHRGEAGDQPVVWWGPSALRLGVDPPAGLRQETLLAASEAGETDAGTLAYRAWIAGRNVVLAGGSVPAHRVVTATALSAETAAAAVEIARSDAWDGDVLKASRPHGARFGTLVHAVLAEVAIDADRAAIARLASTLGRVVLATEAEIAAAVEAVAVALAHPLMVRAHAAGPRREVPIVLPRADGQVVEGVIDLAFREDGRWVVVDYKTDIGPIDPAGKYAAQLALYVEAIEAATGERASAVLLRV
jgi:ATP-dependent exoDNAse (exonuclease V) beta subunit